MNALLEWPASSAACPIESRSLLVESGSQNILGCLRIKVHRFRYFQRECLHVSNLGILMGMRYYWRYFFR
jgi:hypothetical protein